MEKLYFQPSKIWIAEAENGNMQAKFALCDFSVNLNGTKLDRDTIENWMGTIVNQPLVGKIVRNGNNGSEDFAGHEMQKTYVKDDLGNLVQTYTFQTAAYGTFTDVAIESIDGKEYIVATAEIWDRYPKTVRLIKDRIASGTLHTSWEISVKDSVVSDDGIKTIKDGYFKGLAMLGASVQPAYPDASYLMEVAEANEDELVSAMEEDWRIEMEKNKELELATEEPVADDESVASATEPEAEGAAAEPVADPETEHASAEPEAEADTAEPENAEQGEPENAETDVASLTVEDLYRKLDRAIHDQTGFWGYISYLFPEEHTVWYKPDRAESQLDYTLYVYEVVGDEVIIDEGTPVKLAVSIASVNETLAEKDAALAAALAEATSLREQVAELEKVKAAYDKLMAEKDAAAKEAQKAELRTYAMKSGLFTEGELAKGNAKKLIDNLDKAGINQMIADRYMAKLKSEPETSSVETASANSKETAAVDLTAEDHVPVKRDVLQAYLMS